MKYLTRFSLTNYFKKLYNLIVPNVSKISDNDSYKYMTRNYSKEYFTTEVLDSGTITLTIGEKVSTYDLQYISYSLDNGQTWTKTNNVDNTKIIITTPTLSTGDKVLWKGKGYSFSASSPGSHTIGSNSTQPKFSSTCHFDVYGNIVSLFCSDYTSQGYSGFEIFYNDHDDDEEGDEVYASSYYWPETFSALFENSTLLINAKNLILPATTLSNHCYYKMFYGCTSLITAPELPATTLAKDCYEYMFNGCISLTTAPEILPATILATECYRYMFYGCTSLAIAPKLPATTLANDCYDSMFYGCTSLTTAPELPATILMSSCYYWMFNGCTSLTTAPGLPATTLANSCYWSIFRDCTSLTTAPELPATTLTKNCYYYMFYGCTSLTTAPELPATTLDDNCYGNMFYNCTSLNYIKCLATNISASSCTSNWVSNVAATGTFIKESSMTSWTTGADGIPFNWIALTNINDIPIQWSQLSYSYPINAPSKPELVNPYNLPVTYSSSNTNVATIDNSGNITYITTGTCVLSAIFAGNEDYSATTLTCTLSITAQDNSYEMRYLTIISLANNNTISWKANNASAIKTISISTNNGQTWTNKTSTTTGIALATLNTGDKLLIKGSNPTYAISSDYYNSFASTNNFNIEGNIMSLIYGDNFIGKSLPSMSYIFKGLFRICTKLISSENLILPSISLTNYCYSNMFRECTSLTTAPELPATTLAIYCYQSLFYGCTSLTTTPELPATTLANGCYIYMFYGCTSLTTASELPATTLATYCYYQMFYNCTSLTTAPELPATTLVDSCYYSMFQGCTSLITAPELPVTTLVNLCYAYMFSGCTSLNYIKCLATTKINSTNISNWVKNVSASGTFIKNSSTTWPTGVSGIPSGWTVQNAS